MEPKYIKRDCIIRKNGDNLDRIITIEFELPRAINEDEFEAKAIISCYFFRKTIYSGGIDQVQAFFGLMDPVIDFLRAKQLNGYKIFWHEEGDLSARDFWRYKL